MAKNKSNAPSPMIFRLIVRYRMDDWHFVHLDRVLSPIAAGIRKCGKTIDRADQSGNDEYAQMVADDEVEVVEGLLGAAFVVCQTHVERVTHAVDLLHKHARKLPPPRGPVKLATTATGRSGVMGFGSVKVGTSSVTEVQAINAVANYFKHRDSWPGDWTRLTATTARLDRKDHQTASTMRTLQAIGLSGGSSGNLRTAAEALGNGGYADVDKLVDILQTWQRNLFQAYETELTGHGLM